MYIWHLSFDSCMLVHLCDYYLLQNVGKLITPRSSQVCPFLTWDFHSSLKNYSGDYFCADCSQNSVTFMFITSLDFTPPYSCLFSCSSPSEIWLKNIYIVHHPRNAEEKRNLKHGSFVCLIKPPQMMMQPSRKSKLLLWYVGFSSS